MISFAGGNPSLDALPDQLCADLARDALLADGKLNISGDNLFLIATFPTLLICWYKKGSLFGALAVGMGTVALIRYWMT